MTDSQGWIQLHRSLKYWEWFTDVNTSHLFIYCLLRANHKDTKWRGVEIGRGQFITSLDTISKETGLSVMQVRTAIKKLEMTNELTNQSTNINRLITVTNYNKYQQDNKQDNKPLTKKQQTYNKAVTTDNNENNNNNENNKTISIPPWLPIDDWNAFLEMRKKNKSPPTDKAKQMLITKLGKLKQSGNDPSEVLQQSTMNNYKGIFEVRNDKRNNKSQSSVHDDFTKGIALGLAKLNEKPGY